ncbi:hypothetical protein F9Y90_00265 [Borrelia miyamotoi]|uniref:Uncharacterized protein n=1 Tax=Borrelia miyamotoi TaxID=47466 RepID=A0AAX3JLT5_9SPIR|nr:hypothetical protein [Borrelia miyamotoi]QFP41590.1 hypothetical protein F9Y90_00265 [Borrelia miyamotoi]QFP47710.1 hypothetical protein F9Y91_00260 [Borrelia miyamotoi]QGT55471.1 hypothetical protein GNY89_00265 [Borrelia miyamotoi]QGT56253.1 hypothetical protein GNY88_00265 [Borrelia miyamotoi]WAZ71496.1 hypothetical protein O5404_00265 [Borrelia miyamotoi]
MFNKSIFILCLVIFSILIITNINASSKFFYAEQWYVIFNEQIKRKPDNYKRNIFFLKNALKYPFGNPNYSLSKIETREEWNKYKLLFKMHVNLLLVKQHLYLGDLFDTRHAYFYKTPKKNGILENLNKAINLYKIAADYYTEALKHHNQLHKYKFTKIQSNGITNWEDEYYRIEMKELNYYNIIEKELIRIEKTKEFFKNKPNYY